MQANLSMTSGAPDAPQSTEIKEALEHSSTRQKNKKKNKSVHSFFWGLAAVVTLCFFVLSMTLTVSDIYAWKVRWWLEAWQNQTILAAKADTYYEPAEQEWQSAKKSAEIALRFAPYMMDNWDAMATVYASRFPMRKDGDAEMMPYLHQSLDYYRKEIHYRPTWPFPYMAVATTLRRMGRLDDEFEKNIRLALHYGYWEPNVLLAIANNVDVMNKLQPSARQLFESELARGIGWTQKKDGRPVPYGSQILKQLLARSNIKPAPKK